VPKQNTDNNVKAKSKIELGPFFFAEGKEKDPAANVRDLGVGMMWGAFPFYAKLYRRVHGTASIVDKFGFDDVVVDSSNVRVNFSYPSLFGCNTATGTYLPLTYFLMALYLRETANRNPFEMLRELDGFLPPDRRSTLQDIQHFCRTMGKEPGLPPPQQVDPPTGMLQPKLEEFGFRLVKFEVFNKEVNLRIGWQPKAGARVFFVGIIHTKIKDDKRVVKWDDFEEGGIDLMLYELFRAMALSDAHLLTEQGRAAVANAAEQKDDWHPQRQNPEAPPGASRKTIKRD
jgi:hypothetical protein